MPFAIRDVPGLRGGGSDHASFLTAGVPGFFWGQAGKAVYSRTHHTQHDTYDAAVADYQKHSSVVAALRRPWGSPTSTTCSLQEAMVAPERARPGRAEAVATAGPSGSRLDDLKVVEVIEGGAAEKAGVRDGDEIVKIGGKAVASREDFVAALQAAEPSTKLVVRRDGKEVELPLTLPARP